MLSAVIKGLFYLAVLPAALILSGWQGWSWWSWANNATAADDTVEAAGPDGGESPELDADPAADPDADPDIDPDIDPDADPAPPLVQVDIEPGTSAQQIGRDLLELGLIRSAAAWNLWTRLQALQGRQGGFLAGTYAISPEQSMEAIAEKIWQGDVVERSLTIPEGWSVEDIIAYFVEQDLGSETEVRQALRQVDTTAFPWLPKETFDQPEQRFEGFLYPDTYAITEAATPDAVFRQMLERFEEVALPLYQRADSPYSLLEWVTLASIVERESVVDEERQRIAAVFARRLEEGIPLGADPTVEYALGIRQTPDRPLTYAQVETDSPYNTYINPGLPPGPIASPGVESLEVSLDPPPTEYLYFVARYDGTHVFSRTFAEHQRAQARIRDGLQSSPQGDVRQPAPAPTEPTADGSEPASPDNAAPP